MKEYLFLVENATMVEAYADIFNIIASFFSSPLYLEIIKIIFLIGGFTTFLTMIFSMLKMDLNLQKQVAGPFKRGSILLGYLLIVTALFITTFTTDKVNMVIKTNQLPVYCTKLDRSNQPNINGNTPISGTVVGNVPWLWAWIMTSINDVGHSLTNFANIAFGSETANNTRANYVDFLQASSGILSTKLSDFSSDLQNTGLDTSLESALMIIQRDCVLMPASKTSYLMSQDDLNNLVGTTGDIYRTLDNYISYGNLISYKNPTDKQGVVKATNFQVDGVEPKNFLARINGDFLTCGRLWDGIKTFIQNLDNNQSAVCKKDLYKVLNGSNMSVFTGRTELPPTPETSNIILQAAMMNQVINNKSTLPAEIQYASGKSMAQIAINSAGTGFYMAKMMPYLQMTLRAILYAFIPFVFLVIILPGGIRVLASFIKTLLWVELWMPVAALLNMFIMTQISEKFAVAYQTQGLNAFNAYSVYSDAFMMAGVAGYLYAAIPAITWMILTGSAAMIGNITSGLVSQVSSNFESKTINQDMQKIQTSRTFNRERLEKGQEIMSLAEQEKMASGMSGIVEAGSMDVRSEVGDEQLSRSSYGTEKRDILEGIGKEISLKDKATQAAMVAESQMNIESKREELKAKGVGLDKNLKNSDFDFLSKIHGEKTKVDFLTATEIQKNITVSQRIEANNNIKLKEIGEALGVFDALHAQLSGAGIGSKKLLNDLKNKNPEAILEASRLMSPVGMYGKGATDSISDLERGFLNMSSISLEDDARKRASNTFAEIAKNTAFMDNKDAWEAYKKTDVFWSKNIQELQKIIDDPDSSEQSKRVARSIMGMMIGKEMSTYISSINTSGKYKAYKEIYEETKSYDFIEKGITTKLAKGAALHTLAFGENGSFQDGVDYFVNMEMLRQANQLIAFAYATGGAALGRYVAKQVKESLKDSKFNKKIKDKAKNFKNFAEMKARNAAVSFAIRHPNAAIASVRMLDSTKTRLMKYYDKLPGGRKVKAVIGGVGGVYVAYEYGGLDNALNALGNAAYGQANKWATVTINGETKLVSLSENFENIFYSIGESVAGDWVSVENAFGFKLDTTSDQYYEWAVKNLTNHLSSDILYGGIGFSSMDYLVQGQTWSKKLDYELSVGRRTIKEKFLNDKEYVAITDDMLRFADMNFSQGIGSSMVEKTLTSKIGTYGLGIGDFVNMSTHSDIWNNKNDVDRAITILTNGGLTTDYHYQEYFKILELKGGYNGSENMSLKSILKTINDSGENALSSASFTSLKTSADIDRFIATLSEIATNSDDYEVSMEAAKLIQTTVSYAEKVSNGEDVGLHLSDGQRSAWEISDIQVFIDEKQKGESLEESIYAYADYSKEQRKSRETANLNYLLNPDDTSFGSDKHLKKFVDEGDVILNAVTQGVPLTEEAGEKFMELHGYGTEFFSDGSILTKRYSYTDSSRNNNYTLITSNGEVIDTFERPKGVKTIQSYMNNDARNPYYQRKMEEIYGDGRMWHGGIERD